MTAQDVAVDAGPQEPFESLQGELERLGELLRGAGGGEVEPVGIKHALENFWQDHESTLRAEAAAMTEQVRLETIEELNKWREQLLAARKPPEPAPPPDSGTAGPPAESSGGSDSLPVQSGNGKITAALTEPDGGPSAAFRELEKYRLSKDPPQAADGDEPDVLLDVLLKVELIELLVEGLSAHVSVEAQIADLVKLSVGADANLDRLKLTIKGVEATALLKVRLEEVRLILDKALTVLGENPEILLGVLNTVDNVLGEVGDVVREAVGPGGALTRLTDELGGAVREAVGPGGALTQLTDELGGAVREAVGPGGALTQLTDELGGAVTTLTDELGGAVREAVGPGGALTQLTDELGDAVREAVGPGGALTQLTQGLGDAVRESMGQLTVELGAAVRESVSQLTEELSAAVREAVVEAGASSRPPVGVGEAAGQVEAGCPPEETPNVAGEPVQRAAPGARSAVGPRLPRADRRDWRS